MLHPEYVYLPPIISLYPGHTLIHVLYDSVYLSEFNLRKVLGDPMGAQKGSISPGLPPLSIKFVDYCILFHLGVGIVLEVIYLYKWFNHYIFKILTCGNDVIYESLVMSHISHMIFYFGVVSNTYFVLIL